MSCEGLKQHEEWTYVIPDHGSNSTPRFADLNNDGILDIIMGAGRNEHEIAKYGVIAIDGANGVLLWHHQSDDQIVGSASFLDINADGISDVIIGGRSHELFALNGKNGDLIWEYIADDSHPKRQLARWNFYNSQIISDVDGDLLNDILISNGGNVWALPNSEVGREAGTLMVLSSKDGHIIALDTMPDGKETYFSPVYIEQLGNVENAIIYGTGGETSSGHLYMTTLEALLAEDISESIVLQSETGHGYIAPVTIADMNNDGVYDIVGNSHRATVFCIDGSTLKELWHKFTEGSESSNMVLPGYFRSLNERDVFIYHSLGVFPHNKGTVQTLLDGKSGEVIKSDTLGCFSFASPILIQADEDSYEEVMFVVNDYFKCSILFKDNVTDLMVSDYSQNEGVRSFASFPGKNLSVTPSIIDLDGDSHPELVHVVMDNFSTIFLFYGMKIIVKSTDLPDNQPHWNTYMGKNYDCILD